MKQAPGILSIQYKVNGSNTIHDIPAVSEKSTIVAPNENTKGGMVTKVKLSFRVVENDDNATFIAAFLQNIRQNLLYRVYMKSGKVNVVGNNDFATVTEMTQNPGEKAGDFIGYIFEVTWTHPLFV